MSNLVPVGFFVDEWMVEKSNEVVEYRIPHDVILKIDKDLIMSFDEVRSVDVGIWLNGDKRVRIWLKQYELSACGSFMHYR